MISPAIRTLTLLAARITFAGGRLGQVHGLENIGIERRFLLVSNHRSGVDSFLLGFVVRRALGRTLCVPTKEQHLRHPVVGYWLRTMGAEPIALDRPDAVYEHMARWVAEGRTLLMFPEGTRGSALHLQPFRYGAFNLAVTASLPIVPVAVYGTDILWPTGSWWFNRSASASVAFGAPVRPHADAATLRNTVHREIQRLFDQLRTRATGTDGLPPTGSAPHAVH